MSTFLNLTKDFSNLDEILQKYDSLLDDVEEKLNPVGKTLKEANSNVSLDYVFFARKLQELKSIEKRADNILQQKKAESWTSIKNNHNLDLNTRDIEVMCKNTPAYQTYSTFLILIQEMVGQYEVVVKAFEHLSYKLKDITAARIAECQEYVI